MKKDVQINVRTVITRNEHCLLKTLALDTVPFS